MLVQITVLFQFHYFVLLLIIVDTFHHTSIMASIPSERYNNNWIKIHKNHCFQVKQENINSIIIGDSIVAGLTRYTNIWNNLFGNSFINLGISGDCVENVLWRAREIPFIPSLKNVVILCGTNNINKDSPYDIAQGLIAIGSAFKNQPSNPNIFICGILPRDGYCSINRLTINEINDLLESRCLVKSFHFINQNSGWMLNNGPLNFSLFFSDGLHLVEKGNLKLGKSILKAIDSNSNANPYKNAVCFNLNEYDFPTLPSPETRSKPPYAPVKYVGPVRKPFRRLFAQVYEPYRSTVLPAYSVPVSISKASIRSFSSKLKTTSSPKASLSSHQKCAPTSATRSRYSSDPVCFSSIPVTTLSISSPKNSDRAASVSRLPSTTIDCSVNALNSSYVVTTKPLSFKTSKSLVPKSLAPLQTSFCINSSVSESVSNGTIFDSINISQSCVASVQHFISNSKQVVDRDSFNFSF